LSAADTHPNDLAICAIVEKGENENIRQEQKFVVKKVSLKKFVFVKLKF
jgi:hypothetical protein